MDIQASIAPDHNILLSLSWPNENPRGPGFWKFNNSLLEGKEYTAKILELYPQLREKYRFVNDQQLFWKLIKMEIRRTTISFSKGKAQAIRKHEVEIKQQLDELDKIICNIQNLDNIEGILKQYDDLKKEVQHQYEKKRQSSNLQVQMPLGRRGQESYKIFL